VIFRGVSPNRALAAEQFAQYAYFYCNGTKFSMEVKAALFSLLLSVSPTVEVDKVPTITFYLPIMHHESWQAIFNCMQESDFEVRKSALEDVNTLLHDSFKNARSLERTAAWQTWIYQLLCDIPRKQNRTQKTVYGYVLNSITLVHYAYFMESPHFHETICDSLNHLHMYAGFNYASAQVAQTVLLALINKLTAQKNSLTSDTNYDSIKWKNMMSLWRLIRKFVFQTAFWKSETEEEVAEEQEMKPQETEKKKKDTAPRESIISTRASADERAKLVQSLEIQRRKKQEEFCLARCRSLGNAKNMAEDPAEPLITDFGLHWDENGYPADIALLKKLNGLLKACYLEDFDPNLQSSGIVKTDRDFLQNASQEAHYWLDATKILAIVHRKYIDEDRALTYRRLSFVVQAFIQARTTKDRESIYNEVKGMFEKLPPPPKPQAPKDT